MVTSTEQYLFDVNGYIVVKNALSAKQLDHINAMIDRMGDLYQPEGKTRQGHYETYLEHDEVMRSLIDNPRVIPYLRTFMGVRDEAEDYKYTSRLNGVRLDHTYFIFSPPGTPGAQLHLGNIPYTPSCSYNVRDRTIFSNLTVVSYVLNEVPPGQGGFACIPGSHKANFPCPPEYSKLEELSNLCAPKVEPGDAVMFTEALTHGSFAWTAPHTRRALFYKYSPAHMTWSHPRWNEAVLDACTPEQRAMLEPPYVVNNPEFFVPAPDTLKEPA